MMTRPRILTGLLLSVSMLASFGNAQTKTVTISANNGAPLFDAVMQIEKLSGARIFYESTRDEFAGAYEDVTARNSHPEYEKIHGMPPKRILGPKAIPLSAAISVDAATGYLRTSAAVEEALKAVIAAYNAGPGPGAFTLEAMSGTFYVKPTHMRDERGQRVPFQALLATTISLQLEKRPSQDTLRLMSEQIMTKTGEKIRLADNMADFVAPISVSASGNNEQAAVVLSRLLGSVDTQEGQRDVSLLPISTLTIIYHSRVVGFLPGIYRMSARRVPKSGVDLTKIPPQSTLPPPTFPPGIPRQAGRRPQ